MLFNEVVENHSLEFYSKNKQLYVRYNENEYRAFSFLKSDSEFNKAIRNELAKFIRKKVGNEAKNLSLMKVIEIFNKNVPPPDIHLKIEIDNNKIKDIIEINFDIEEFNAGLAKFKLLDKNFE